MWSQPWGYREAFAIPSGLLTLGIVSHFALGVIPDYAFSYPQNLIGGLLLTALSVAVALLAKRYATARFFCSYKAAIGSMSLWCAVIVIMGLTRQIDPTLIQAHGLHSFVHWTGWESYTLHPILFAALPIRSFHIGRCHAPLLNLSAQRTLAFTTFIFYPQPFRTLSSPLGRTHWCAPNRKVPDAGEQRSRVPRMARNTFWALRAHRYGLCHRTPKI